MPPAIVAIRRVLGWFAVGTLVVAAGTDAAEFASRDAFLQRNCLDCHSGTDAAGGLKLDLLGRDLAKAELLARWVGIYDRIDRGEMPPRDEPQPTAAERSAFLTPLRDALTTASRVRAQTVLRRLNRAEYEQTVNDLLGTNESLAELLPEDGRASGFDKLGEALDLSPTQVQSYMEAAGAALDACLTHGPRPKSSLVAYQLADGRNAEHVGRFWKKLPDGTVVVFLSQGPSATPSDLDSSGVSGCTSSPKSLTAVVDDLDSPAWSDFRWPSRSKTTSSYGAGVIVVLWGLPPR